MRIGSLFSGIGGLEMGLTMANPVAEVVWQAECDPYALAVLAHHWPTVRRYTDVRDIDETATRVDVVCGGFPCQPHSLAGKRRGTSDERWIWPEFARIVGVLKPSYVFIENVPGLRTSGLRDVLADLASLGFDAEWDLFGAYEAGAHFQGERLYLLATANQVDGRARVEFHGQHSAEVLRTCERESADLRTAPAALADKETDGLSRRLGTAALGNAVYPPQAALAWRTLIARTAQRMAA